MLKRFFLVLFLGMILVSTSLAADLYSNKVSVQGTETHVIYYGKITMPTTDNAYTRWFDIADLTEDNAYCWCVCSDVTGTEDVNVYAEYSPNCDSTSTGFLTGSAVNGLDALTITPKRDTLNVIQGVSDPSFKTARYMRLKFDGQTGNPATVLSWWVMLKRCPIYNTIKGAAGSSASKKIN